MTTTTFTGSSDDVERRRDSIDDAERRRALRRMKSVATAVLLVAAAVWLLARVAESSGAPTWVGFVRAAAEAAMVGGLADWFAVTALFRHPLGIPIPHTALIPERKDALGRNLSTFVGTHFLAEDVIRTRIARIGVGQRVGEWLSDPGHAARVSAEAAAGARGLLEVLSDDDVQQVLEGSLLRRLADVPVGPPLGRVLEGVLADRAHTGAVDLLAERAGVWLLEHRDDVVVAVTEAAPAWTPRFVDEAVGLRVHAELVRVAAEVRADPDHPLRRTIDRALWQFAHDLRHDEGTQARAQAAKDRLLTHPETRRAVADLSATLRRLVLEAVDDPDSELRRRVTAAVVSFGRRLLEDPGLRAKVDGWAEDVAAHVVTTYRDELTRTITETVDRWDGEETSRRIELAAGRDLQFIRINGAVVGALAGVVIHAVGLLL